jgi:hypothetical protein
MQDDLHNLADDMVAFIEGHGMRRFQGYVDAESVPTVPWESGDNPDSWKDFVELAKGAGTPFLTMNSVELRREDVDYIIDTLRSSNFADDDDMEDARLMRAYIGKTGYVQLGWAYAGIVFTFDASTEWYERYQRLSEMAEEFGGMVMDSGEDE